MALRIMLLALGVSTQAMTAHYTLCRVLSKPKSPEQKEQLLLG